MKLTDKTIVRIIGVAVGIVAVAGTAYAVTATIPDKPDETSTTNITTEQAPQSENSDPEQGTAVTIFPVSSTAPLTSAEESTVKITTEAAKEITFQYDAALSKQIAEMIVEKYPEMQYNPRGTTTCHPENFVHGERISSGNNLFSFIGEINGNVVQVLETQWEKLSPDYIFNGGKIFDIEAYQYSNGYYAIFIQ